MYFKYILLIKILQRIRANSDENYFYIQNSCVIDITQYIIITTTLLC